MPVIVAALAHAAYRYGEFGDGRRTATPAKRAEVAAAIGAESERLVYRYAEMPWRELLQRAADGVPCTSVEDAALMLIRVANEIEDHMDLTAPSRGIDADAHLRRCADAAACLGHAQLAAAIESARGEIATRATAEISHADDAVPDDAWSYAGAAGSFLLPPRSHRARAVPALRYRLRQSPLARVLYRRTLQLLR